ncbi:uncharacterized protein LOC111699021, partial [Eurytemora carolleeae]|uniref:uncharacterized protein LOC111699021 n=1 Tax=Eurytemora carolleeae TaxID=1294199 RepID=UPI000C78D9CA
IYKNLSESETKRGFMVRGTVHLEKTQNLNSQTSFKSMLRSKSLRRGNQLTDPNMFSISSSDPERGQSMLSGRPGENMERETNFGGTPSFRVQFNQLKRKRERSNLILLAIVLLFIFSHSFRILFKAIELTFIDNHVSLEVFNFCYEKGRYIIPPAWLCLSHVNHLFLVLNSALNFFLYCLVGRRFRQELQLCICRLIRRRRQNI